jgi:SAM-dependent methyltransferase
MNTLQFHPTQANGRKISEMDVQHLALLRKNVEKFLKSCAKANDMNGYRVLDIAPQVHEGATPHFQQATIETLDINPSAGATYTADICQNNSAIIPDNHFDIVICTEVLEHTLQPFNAVAELHRILKPGGKLYLSTPFNFRIHGPLPDCWRFTEHGLRALLVNYEIEELKGLESDERFLMPIHYTTIARKKE